VYVDGTGSFTKTGGVIYGDTDKTHTAGSNENTAASGYGHAVYGSTAWWRNTAVAAADALGVSGGSYSGAWHANLDDFSMCPVTIDKAFAVYGPTETDWQAALTAISSGGSNKNYIIYVYDTVSGVTGTASSSFGSVTGIKAAVRGGGSLELGPAGSLIRAGANQTLILRDITLRGILTNNAPLVYTNGTTTALTMYSGAVITGNTNTSSGGGVYVNNGIFTMSGGTISDNTTTFVSGSSSYGGGVFVNTGNFIMYGGTISDNTARSSSGGHIDGGGVSVDGSSGSFTMYGGTISGNDVSTSSASSSGSSGGGVYVRRGTFTMNGGAISDNTVSTVKSSSGDGGGVSVEDGNFTMTGGTISGNVASGSGAYGGGVSLYNSGIFIKTGGTIYGDGDNVPNNGNATDNTAGKLNGGNAVSIYSGTKKRNDTAGPGIGLVYDPPDITGWD
jgi:hypothetical protein